MRAIISTLDPDGVAVSFDTEEMKLNQLLDLLPQIKAHLIKAGYTLVDSHPAQQVDPAPAAAALSVIVDRITATVDDGKV